MDRPLKYMAVVLLDEQLGLGRLQQCVGVVRLRELVGGAATVRRGGVAARASGPWTSARTGGRGGCATMGGRGAPQWGVGGSGTVGEATARVDGCRVDELFSGGCGPILPPSKRTLGASSAAIS